ncbi:MAG: short-chain dehydrogenase [Verrucomicrobia bacterium]|nr:short-chain dehydrogenase [Verrucomicrobiota bacterium]
MINPVPQFSLTGKVIVQIGGPGLLGPALVTALANAGATVVITSRQRAKAEAIAVAERARGFDVHGEECTPDSEPDVLGLRDRVLAEHQRIDGLVYNAMNYPMRGGWNDDIARWQQSMATNATGYFATVRAFGDAMAARGSGSIVSISSIHGIGGPNPWLYEGTTMKSAPDYFFHKAGMTNLTRFMAAHYGPKGVRANTVAPGGITDELHPDPAEFVARYGKMTALGRMAEPAEVSGAVVFLLSDAASYITGSTLAVDGGYSAR